MTKIIVIPGSARADSYNRQLASTITQALSEAGAEATLVNLGDYPMPIFNEDKEAENGTPEKARELAALIAEHKGVVLVSPEYNASLSPLLKNTLDWLSRDVGVKTYQNRVFALAAASPGGLGGIRGLSHVRDVLVNVGAEMITPQLAVGSAMKAFDENGGLVDERAAGLLKNLCETLIARTKDL